MVPAHTTSHSPTAQPLNAKGGMRTLSRADRSSSMLTGFITLEEVHLQASTSCLQSATLWKRRRSLRSLTEPKWFHAVFQRGVLRCYRRRTDIKLNRDPFRVVPLDLEATLISERQTLIVQSRKTGKTLRLRVHSGSSSTYLQWVTALYLARLDSSESDRSSTSSDASSSHAKRVRFNEDGTELIGPSVDSPTAPMNSHESGDLSDLYYTREDLEGFRRSHRQAQKSSSAKIPLRVGRTVVKSIVSRLRSREAPRV